ncbi:MAG: actin-binding WH2 domain-containing protein [Cyanosarcina radialis HA8281-LM2]|jgi:hypothetical protein|nr:actin-binding WH2 domain-containing protein [Cyanosarcina radialis HA8281-LM2]
MNPFAVLINLLRDRTNFLIEISKGIKLESKIFSLLVASSVFLAIYGAIIGASHSWMQSLSSAVKLPALYLITLIICLPTLYFFDILFGSALTFGQYAALSLTTVSVISVLLFSFAPITLFILVSIHDYLFFQLLNVGIFSFTGIVGVKLFYDGMQSLTKIAANSELKSESEEVKPEYANQQTRDRLLQFWLILYGLVGSQLGWTLRPFFGAPSEPFQLFRNIEGNFYAQVFRAVLTLLGAN